MKNSTTICFQFSAFISRGLLGVILFILMPVNTFSFQVDSLLVDTTLTGIRLGEITWGDYDNDGDLDILLTGDLSTSSGTSKIFDNDGAGNFTENGSISITSLYRSDAKFGDYDNDGDLDFAITGLNSSGASVAYIYTNNGDGSFTSSGISIQGVQLPTIAWGDSDNDGDLDLLLTGYANSPVSAPITYLYQNNGNSTFSYDTSFAGTFRNDIEFIDFDNDGDKDIFLTGTSDANNPNTTGLTKVYQNNGSGSYSEVSLGFTNLGQSSGAWADFNKDGFFDLAISGLNTSGVATSAIYINDGDGTFTASASSIATLYSGDISAGDYDLDGDIDLIMIGINGSGTRKAIIYDNDGAASFSENTDINYLSGLDESTAEFVDFDNDGDLDVAISGQNSSSAMNAIFYKNTESAANNSPSAPSNLLSSMGNDTLTVSWDAASDTENSSLTYEVFLKLSSSTTYLTSPESDTSNGFRRVNKLGKQGLNRTYSIPISEGSYQWGVQAIDASGKGGEFAISTFNVVPPDTPTGIVIVDNYELLSVNLSWNQQSGVEYFNIYIETDSTVTPTVDDTTHSNSIELTNFADNDEYFIYLAAVDSSGLISNLSNAFIADFRFTLRYDQTISSQFVYGTDMEWVDFDNDGDMDLSIAGNQSNLLYVNNGGTSLSAYSSDASTNTLLNSLTSSTDLANLAWIDYNNDGWQDFVISGTNGGTQLIKNTGTGFINDTLVNTSSFTSATGTGFVDWGDYDNDGDVDLLVVGGSTGKIVEFNFTKDSLGSDTLTFTSISGLPSASFDIYGGDAEFVDVNNDGFLDVSITAPFNLLINNGDKTFTNANSSVQALDNATHNWGDVDNDGDLDLALTGYKSDLNGFTAVYKNDGNGALSLHATLDAFGGGEAEWGDYDADGDLDLMLIGRSSTRGTSTFATFIYDNDGAGNLTKNTRSGFTNVGGYGSVDWVDIDNDNDLDLALMGYHQSPVGYYSYFYENGWEINNSPPSSPANLRFEYIGGGKYLKLIWDESIDSEGGPISYNAYLTSPDDTLILNAQSEISSGARRQPGMGNSGINNFYTIDITNFSKGYYKMGVQAIDGSFGYSTFSTLDSLPIKLYFELTQNTLELFTDSVQVISRSIFDIKDFLSDSTMLFSITKNTIGKWFKDTDNNFAYSSSDSTFDGAFVHFDSPTDSLLFYSDTAGYNKLTFKISTLNGALVDSLDMDVVVSQTKPEFEGNADQGGWYLLSNPLNTTLGAAFDSLWTQGAVNADSESGTPNLYTFNPDSAKYLAITSDLDTTKVAAGEGILMFIFPDDNYNDSEAPINGGWPKTLSNFGNPFGNNINVGVRNTDTDSDGFTSGSEGFMLMGNPFGFGLDIESVISKMVNIDVAANRYVYRWNPITKTYQLFTSGKIDPYESFFVRTIQSGISGNAVFEYEDVHSSARLKNTPKLHPIELNLFAGDVATGEYALRLAEDALTEIDPFDGYYLGSFASNFANLYSTIGDQPLVLNNLPSVLGEVVEIPLYLHTTESGEHRLEWSVNAFPEEWSVELENPNNGDLVDLTSESAYTFNFAGAHYKKSISQALTPNLFAFYNQAGKEKSKAKQPDLILRINPGLASNNENDLGIPREVELYQNYPNPFNPSSIIRFGVPEQATVHLEVFDILGRKVMSLLNGEVKKPGRYNIAFDGRALASGMYIYRLVIGDKVLTKKMTLIK